MDGDERGSALFLSLSLFPCAFLFLVPEASFLSFRLVVIRPFLCATFLWQKIRKQKKNQGIDSEKCNG